MATPYTVSAARPRRFTIIELMVVIGIIVILASILLPALNMAREKAREISCLNNLKQLGLALMMYPDEYDEYALPADTDFSGGYDHWMGWMVTEGAIGAEAKTLLCPSMPADGYFDPYGTDLAEEGSYIMNAMTTGSTNWDATALTPNDPVTAHGWTKDSFHDAIRITRVPEPWDRIYVTDAAPYLGHNSRNVGINEDENTDWGDICAVPESITDNYRLVGYHHSNRFNTVWGDGHASPVRESLAVHWAVNE